MTLCLKHDTSLATPPDGMLVFCKALSQVAQFQFAGSIYTPDGERHCRVPIRPALFSGLYVVIKQLGVFLLPPGLDASPSKGFLLALNLPLVTHLYCQGKTFWLPACLLERFLRVILSKDIYK